MNTNEENGDGLSNCEEEHFQSYLIEKSIYPIRIYLPIDMIRYVYSFLGAKTLDEYKDNILALRLEYIEQQETYRKIYLYINKYLPHNQLYKYMLVFSKKEIDEHFIKSTNELSDKSSSLHLTIYDYIIHNFSYHYTDKGFENLRKLIMCNKIRMNYYKANNLPFFKSKEEQMKEYPDNNPNITFRDLLDVQIRINKSIPPQPSREQIIAEELEYAVRLMNNRP